VQYYGTTKLDASALLIPLVGFCPPAMDAFLDRRCNQRHLMTGRLVAYDPAQGEDGLGCLEGTSGLQLWLADNLALLGRYREARALFERLLALQRRRTIVGRV
jgi:GH15 family glucan-1,4-alpha-glucosidase